MKKKKIILIVAAAALLLCAALLFLGKSRWPNGLIIGKTPDRYTWEEYEALSREDKDVFFEWFDSVEAFEAWMKDARPEETAPVIREWDQPEKLPDTFTWNEYQALTPEEQEAFYRWFGSMEAFEAWQETVMPGEPAFVWDRPGKQPDAYTWEEYQALSLEEQDAFFHWFASVEAFEMWMETAAPGENTEPVIDWQNAEKQPDAYTWEEYQQLSQEEQDAFFLWFDSVEAFEAWMTGAMGN